MSAANPSTHVTKNIEVAIKPYKKETVIDEQKPIYAINWFNSKRLWLYKFYNLLAIRSVLKVGGKPYLKASCGQLIIGDPTFNRNIILIVRYPNPAAFLKLISNKYFQIISVFRNAAVDNFTFGFATKKSDNRWEKNDNSFHYILHHYQSDNSALVDFKNIINDTVEVFFSGSVDKGLFVTKKPGEEKQLPNLIDELIIYRSQDKELLKQFLTGEKYLSVVDSKLKVSSLVELSREF